MFFLGFLVFKVEGLGYDFFQTYLGYPDPLDRRNGLAQVSHITATVSGFRTLGGDR